MRQGVNEISFQLILVHTVKALPDGISPGSLAQSVRKWMHPYTDTPEDTERGISDALHGRPAPGGFVVCATENTKLIGALVMLRTGMSGYIPPNLLLFLAVSPTRRRAGIGTQLVNHALEHCSGPVKLHVEADNPAKFLYQNVGFTAAYIDMRRAEKAVTHE